MNKITVMCLFFLIANISHANTTEQWECALDLQQGDKGSMSLERSNDSVSGKMSIDRNGREFAQELTGRWLKQEIELKRFIDATSSDAMYGIAIRVGSKQIKIGGRYAEGLNGVWSADCDLVSTNTPATSTSETPTPAKIQPSISIRATPSKPNSRDTIELTAQAFHADGIESIAFFVGDTLIHQCQSNECGVKHGPLRAGLYQWHVIAKSKSGIENAKRSSQLKVSQAKRSGNCTISGIATGSAVAQSSNVTIQLAGKTSGQTIRKSARFNAGIYRFDDLPEGDYVLTIETPASLGILVSPTTKKVRCDTDPDLRQNFEFH